MENDSHTNHAIIREDKSKELSLPSEMIRRGFELAIRIEHKQGIQPISDQPPLKEYIVRCYLSAMELIQKNDRYILKESDKHVTDRPVYLVVSVDKGGLHVSCASTKENLDHAGMEGNEDRYRLLNALNSLKPFTIPLSSFALFYTLSHPAEENHFSRIPKEELKRIKFRLGPTGQPGYKGPATKEANPFYNKNRDCVEIIIVYSSVAGIPNLIQNLVTKNQPQKLTFLVIDQKGDDDLVSSYELYHAILKAKISPSATEQGII